MTVYQPLRILQAKKPLSPNDGQTGMDLNIFLRWQGSMSSKKGTNRPCSISYWTAGVTFTKWPTISNSKLVARVTQQNILNPADGYSSSASFTFDERLTGNAYIFVYTDIGGYIVENNTTNNVLRSSSSIEVKLTPPPDLEVTSIRYPGPRVYSGSNVQLTWTVVNAGEGPTKDTSWWDRVWWSQSQDLGFGAKYFSTTRHDGNIAQNGNYTQSISIKIPEFISGEFYVIIETDVYNHVFENFGENNNLLAKKVQVLLTPPPDLEVQSINVSESWVTGNTVTISWTVQNSGNDSPLSQMYWQDRVKLVSRERQLNYIEKVNGLQPLENYRQNVSVVLPFSIYGNVAFRLVVDNIYKSTRDPSTTNNIFTLSDVEVKLRAADLTPSDNIQINEYILAGKPILVNYRVFHKSNQDKPKM
ncbi:uncharacterized protein LOC128549620 [Mercenaria mercenaria]|uniref:uncharacterized protein LOC128549620 n=1 Tax=Mercenaria mercenaria TaxID=6596 RepID=UPI00234E7C7A|nr:uncharacterized protein LOC128549620 [Mercenaria mercenaria]